MIRINLLGTAKTRKAKRSRKFALPQLTKDGPSPFFTGLAIVAVVCAALYLYHAKLERTHEKLQSDITAADVEIASLTKVKQAYLERQGDYDKVKRRFDIIDQLRAQQQGPVLLLNTVTETVNRTDGVWLVDMHDEGARVSLSGYALGPNAVATLMSNLRRSGYFSNIELRDTQQEDNPKVQTFTFSLVCEKAKA